MRVLNLLAAAVWGDQTTDKEADMKLRGERGQMPGSAAVHFGKNDSGSCSDTQNGNIHTVYSRHSYGNNDRCHREYTCDAGHVAFVKWNRISMENHSSCYYDYAKLSWKNADTGAVTSEWKCGSISSHSEPELFEWRHTFSDHVVVDFYTDYSVTGWGFELQVNCVDESTIDVCSFAMCHNDATCIVDPRDSGEYTCECRPFYSGDGVNSCTFDLGNKFIIDTYRQSSSISDRYVQSEVALVVANQNQHSGEMYTFNVHLDEDEFISSLVMRVGDDGPITKGNVHLEQDAEEIFDNAVSNGQGAALTEETSDSEVSDSSFSTTVFVPAGEKLYIWLNFDMQLSRTQRNYKYRTHIRPSDPIEKLQIIVDIDESRPIKLGQTYTWFESEDKHSSSTFNREVLNNGHVVFSYEQLTVGLDEFDEQLRVEYDVDRPSQDCGDIILRDGYFVHFISPEGIPPMPKNVVITVDTSGSMSYANRMSKARTAVNQFLDQLEAHDTFWLQEFNSYLHTYRSEALAATPGNIATAKQWVSGLNAGGGTALAAATLTSVNRPLDAERANIAFIVSDGQPTVGESNWANIQANTLAANERADGLGQKWAVFNIGVGDGAPITEITKLSTQNMGLARQIFDNDDVVALFAGFMGEYATPLIWNQKFQYDGVSNFDCSATNLYDNQEMVCIGQLENACDAGRLSTPGDGMLLADGVNLFGSANARAEQSSRCKVLDKDSCSEGSNGVPFIPEDQRDLMDNPFPLPPNVDLGKVFAYQFMKRRLDLYHATRNEQLRETIQGEVESLAVDNQFVTIFTSLVVVQGQTRKKRGIEKREAIKALFDEYHHEIAMLQDNETERVRRDLSAASPYPMKSVFILALVALALAALPMRRIRRRLC